MRRTAVGALLGAAVLMVPSPASARFRELSRQASSTGAVTITWHGDRARGCAPAGLCGYRGSVGLRPSDGDLQLVFAGRGLGEVFGSLYVASAPVIRVQRAEETGTGGTCVDLARVAGLELSDVAVHRSRVKLGLSIDGISAGRCAGPELTAALARLPTHGVPVSRLTRAGSVLDLSGRSEFVSGRFAGTVVSTVKVRVGSGEPGGSSSSGPPRHHRGRRLIREVHVHASYLVTGLTGKLSATFGGLAAPLCANLDDCGVTGTASWAILSAGGNFALDGDAVARESDHGLRGALAAIRRAGLVTAYGSLRHALGTTAADVTRPDGAPCHDTATVVAQNISSDERGRASPVLLLDPYEPDREILRTGCPGPPRSDVLGAASPAKGRLRASIVTRRRARLQLSGGGRFDDAAYAGAWRSRFTLGLRRVGVSVSYRRVRVRR